MKQILFSVLLLISFSSLAFSQIADTKNDKIEISVCHPEITESGKQSSFQFSYRYVVMSNENGSIKEV
jgi:hypothetical protein